LQRHPGIITEHLMGSFSIWHWLIVLLVVVLIMGSMRFISGESLGARASKSRGRMPVYSAETIDSREAEFIRERLPERLPTFVFLAALVAVGALVWWFTR
jgi:sec-independent protein translocase protein TatA